MTPSGRARLLVAALVASTAGAGPGCSGRELTTRVADAALSPAVVEPLGEPAVRSTRFHATDESVTLWVALADLDGPHTVRVRWIDPLGRVARDTGPLPINAAGGYRRRGGVTARLPIERSPAAMLPGAWRAQLWLDERPVLEQPFELEGEDT